MANLVWALAAQSNDSEGGAIAAVIGGVFSLVMLVVALIFIASLWKLFTKAGEPGWASLVPIYNMIVLLKISSMPWWWVLLMCIAQFIIPFKLAANFGKGTGFAVGLLLLPFIFLPMLAFGDAQYRPVS
jgi:Ca2+/Na+ antiporter